MKHKFWMPLLGLAALVVAGLACSPSSVLNSGDGSLLKDNFSSDSSGWGTGTDDNSSVEYSGGKLVMKLFRDSYFVWSTSGADDVKSAQNVHIEVTAENTSGEKGTSFGILCDVQVTDSFYYFVVTGSGDYAIVKTQVAKDDEFLASGSSDDIKPGADSYLIGADCADGELTLYVDGNKIDSVKDDTFSKGDVGLFASSGDENKAEVRFDNIVVTEIKDEASK